MSSTINASTASGGGLVTSADATGILQLQTAGTTALTIDASQNVGIGTSSPSSPLTVVTSASSKGVSINGRSSDNLGSLFFYDNNGSTQYATLTASASEFRLASTPAVQTFYTANTERMRIDSAGNVGIGRSPTTFKLEIQNGLACYTTSVQTIFRSHPTDSMGELGTLTSHPLTFITSSGERMRIDSSGNVGIGTVSPTCKLDVATTSSTQAKFTRTGQTAVCTIFQSTADTYLSATNSGAALILATQDVERVRIDSSGNLLVKATATAGYLLNVGDGTGNASICLKSNGSGAVIYGVDTINSASAGYLAGHINTTGKYQIKVGSSGGVELSLGATSWTGMSDARLKNVTGSYNNALLDIAQIQPVKFTWKADTENKPQVGVLAQSVQLVVPEAIDHVRIDKEDKTDYLGVRYTELIPLMIASIQELKAIIDTQNARIESLEAK